MRGLLWAKFVNALKEGEVSRPFLVCETHPEEKPLWSLYAESGHTLVQVQTMRGDPRSWRKLDGAISDLKRAMDGVGSLLPGIVVYASPDAVVFPKTVRK